MQQKFKGGTVEEQRIKVLIIQYEDSIRYRKKLLDCYLAEALLSVIPICMKNQKTLETRIEEKAKECKRLKLSLESAHDRVAKFFTKYSENTVMKEFLDFAGFLSTFRDSNEDISFTSKTEKERLFQYFGISWNIYSYYDKELNRDEHELNGGCLQSDEVTGEETSSILPLNVINEDLLTLNSKLELAQESLNAEKLQSKQLKYERDSLDNLSDKLCYLLFEYQKRISTPDEKKETRGRISQDNDHPNINAACDSSLFTKRNSLVQSDIEFSFDELTLSPSQNSLENSSPSTDIDAASMLSKTSEQNPGNLDQILVDLSDALFQDQLPELPNDDQILSDFVVLFQDQSLEILNEISQEFFGTENKPENDPEDVLENESEINIREKGQYIADKGFQKSIPVTRLTTKEEKIEKNDESSNAGDISHKMVKNKVLTNKGDKIKKNDESSNVGDISHKTVKNKVLYFPCDICNLICMRKDDLKRHILRVHDKKKPHKCQVCAKKFFQKRDLKIHILTHGSEKTFECSVCHKKFKHSRAKSKHQRLIHDGETRFQCTHCDLRFGDKKSLTAHIYSKHLGKVFTKEKRFQCSVCAQRFAWKKSLERHILAHGSERPFKCSICNKTFKQLYNKVRHQRVVHEGDARYQCAHCDKRCSTKSNLTEHIYANHFLGVPKQLKCSFCDKSFVLESLLKQHERKHQPPQFKCTMCAKAFSQKRYLKKHTLVHISERLFECTVCHKKFKDNDAKGKHQRMVHEKNARIQCAHCDKRCVHKANLISHIHVRHFPLIPKRFKCTICDKSFSQNCSLKTHQLAHGTQRLFKCSVCDLSFKYRGSKTRHEWKSHRIGKSFDFRCIHCDKPYRSEKNLICHMQSKHAE